jgi:hypothetical protein
MRLGDDEGDYYRGTFKAAAAAETGAAADTEVAEQ